MYEQAMYLSPATKNHVKGVMASQEMNEVPHLGEEGDVFSAVVPTSLHLIDALG